MNPAAGAAEERHELRAVSFDDLVGAGEFYAGDLNCFLNKGGYCHHRPSPQLGV